MDISITAFGTSLGWMAIAWSEEAVMGLAFGHDSAQSALESLGRRATAEARLTAEQRAAMRRLAAFAEGEPQDFQDIPVALDGCTGFARRILGHCRCIPWGSTATYGELAARSGVPRAARAVGNVMAKNPIPLIIPCHRVVAAGPSLGGFSAPSGVAMKRRLLAMESATLSRGSAGCPVGLRSAASAARRRRTRR